MPFSAVSELHLSSESLQQVAELLSRNYAHDPMLRFNFTCEYVDNPNYWITAHRAFVTMNFRYGRVYCIRDQENGVIAGVACTYPAGVDLPADNDQVGSEWDIYRSMMSPEQVAWDTEFDRQEIEEMAKFAPEDHLKSCFLLRDLVVDAAYQRQGLGDALIKHCIHLASEQHASVLLQTAQDNKVEYYKRRGFRVRAAFPLKHDMGMATRYIMERPPDYSVVQGKA